jgi:hypothetical protein
MNLNALRLATKGFFTSQSALNPITLSAATINAIADAVWDETLSQHLSAGSTGAKLNLASILTVGDIPAGLTAAQVWTYTDGDRSLTGPQAINSAVTLGLIQAFVQGRFKINYSLGKAYQYSTTGTVLQEFDLRDADGNLAITAQTAVDRVPVSGTVAPIGLSLSLNDLEDVNLDNPVDGSIPVWNGGELDITSATTDETLTDGGNF